MLDKLKNPKVSAAALSLLGVLVFIVWQTVTGEAPPAVVVDAIEEHTDAVIDCDDAGADCSITVKAGSGDGSGTPSDELLPHSVAASELEGVDGSGDAEGSE